MADPEIRLPQEPSDEKDHETNPEILHSEAEQRPKNAHQTSDGPPATVGPNQEITWHYLTFETLLPAPAYLRHPPATSNDNDAPQAPPCPDLKSFTSPFLWSSGRKSFITWLSCVATMVTAYTAGSYSPGVEQMTAEWDIGQVAATTGITIFTCGFGVAPMFLAPFSEINGRRPVFVVTGLLFVVFQLTCAVTPTFAGMLVARFLAGCMGSTFSTMVGGVVSDIYHSEDRNAAMSLFTGAALFGTGLGPLCSGFIAHSITWRWIFYLQVITCGVMMAVIALFFKETRGSVLLSRKAKMLNKWYDALESSGHYGMMMSTSNPEETNEKSGYTPMTRPQRIRWKVKSDEERGSLQSMIRISLYRPFHMLFTEPILFSFSLWISFSWAVLYMTFSAIPLIFTQSHGFNLQQSNAIFTSISVAALLSTLLSTHQESFARRWITNPKRRAFLDTPEGRLYFSCIQSFFLPVGLFWLGWTSFPSNHWILPALALACATCGIFSIYLATFNYLADIYHVYASSALAAQSFCRNMLGGAFPLFTRQMFNTMTFQGAGSFLGGVAVALTIVPWVLVFFGPRIRKRSPIARRLFEENK